MGDHVVRQRLALVTGASTGLGRAIALELAQRHIDLLLVARSQAELEDVARECRSFGVEASVSALDLCAPSSVEQLADRVAEMGRLDILVNNAGIATYGAFVDRDLMEVLRVIDLNIRVATELVHRLAPMLIRARGHILNITSVAGLQPSPGVMPYGATKAYLIAFSESIEIELRPHGVRVTTFCPGTMSTPFIAKAGIGRSRAFTLLPVATPEAAAKVAVRSMLANHTFVIPGLVNRALALAIRFTPRRLQKRSVAYLLAEGD